MVSEKIIHDITMVYLNGMPHREPVAFAQLYKTAYTQIGNELNKQDSTDEEEFIGEIYDPNQR